MPDPHGTHKVCLDVIIEALNRLQSEGDSWVNDCWMWLYKGAWQEWDISEIEMAIPMSPDQVRKNVMEYSYINPKKTVFPSRAVTAGSFGREPKKEMQIRHSFMASLA